MASLKQSKPDLFLTTRWTLVKKAQTAGDTAAQKALNDLCSTYWYPVYAFVRRTCASAEDAEDLTQGYFADLLLRGYLGRADREKGRLRAFLLADVKLFLANHRGRQRAAKRGGGQLVFSLDQVIAEQRYGIEPVDHHSPEQLYDRAWAATLLARVNEELREAHAEKGQEQVFDALQQFIAWNAGEQSYAEVAAALGRTVSDIKVSVHRLRKKFRASLERLVADTVSSREEMEVEIRALAAAFG